MRFHTTIKLGPNRELTPAGFTLFRNVSVARTGEMVYGPEETGIEPGDDGLVYITRTPEEVFRAETLQSGNGAPFVIDHPEEDVKPHNWQQLANGFLVDFRRGSGDQKDEQVAELLVTTDYALSEIDAGTREVSVGYDADYIQTGKGRGEQRNIVINHVALVEAGRCGSRCAIRDHGPKRRSDMAKSFKDRVLDAFRSKSEEDLKKVLDEESAEPGATHVHVHTADKAKDEEDPSEKRFKKIEDAIEELGKSKAKDKAKDEEEEEKKKKEAADKARDAESEEEKKKKAEDEETEGELEEEAPEGTKDAARKAKDSAYLEESFAQVKMIAEIIAPGVSIPTFDKAASPKKTFKDCICGLRRKALQLGTNDAVTAGIIEQVRGCVTDGAEFLKMHCRDVRTIFNSVGALKKAANNGAVTRDSSTGRAKDEEMTPAQKFKAASDKRWGIGEK